MIIRPAVPLGFGKHVIRVDLANSDYSVDVDLFLSQNVGSMGPIRSVYINSGQLLPNFSLLTLESNFGQRITVLSNSQGYYPFIVPLNSLVHVTGNGSSASLLFFDFDIPASNWHSAIACNPPLIATASFLVNSNLPVIFPLMNAVPNSLLDVSIMSNGFHGTGGQLSIYDGASNEIFLLTIPNFPTAYYGNLVNAFNLNRPCNFVSSQNVVAEMAGAVFVGGLYQVTLTFGG